MSQSQAPYDSARTSEAAALAALNLALHLSSQLAEVSESLRHPSIPIAIRTFLDRTGRALGSLTVLELLDLSRGGDGLALNMPSIEP